MSEQHAKKTEGCNGSTPNIFSDEVRGMLSDYQSLSVRCSALDTQNLSATPHRMSDQPQKPEVRMDYRRLNRSTEICLPTQPPRDPLLQLVSLQKASGCWVSDPDLAAALGKTSKELEETKPASVKQEVWATILALIWLHGFKMDAQAEWELLAMKAASWLRAQNAACVTECVEAGNALLGCNVQKDKLGL